MSAIPIALQNALDRLLSTPGQGGSSGSQFVDAVWPYIHELAKVPEGVQLLDEYGNSLRDSTALGTPYAEAWRQGVRSALRITTTVRDIEVTEDQFRHDAFGKVKSRRRRTAWYELPNPVMRLRRTSRAKHWLNQLEDERSTIGQVLEAPDLQQRIRKHLEAWWSEANELLCEGRNRHVDGCRILLDMHNDGIQSGGAAMLSRKGFGPAFVEEVKSAAEFLARQLAESIAETASHRNRAKRQSKPSTDFRSVRWHGATYSFTANQAPVVKLLWENFEAGTPDVGDETLLRAVDPAAPPARLSNLFRGHPAWGKMIVAGGTKGSHRLATPGAENQ